MHSSGDVVVVPGRGLYISVITSDLTSDALVRLALPSTTPSVVGQIGVNDVWGLAHWHDNLYGFTQAGGIYWVDIQNGEATLLANTAYNFWGATLAADQVFRRTRATGPH
jgi:hypothetical protein